MSTIFTPEVIEDEVEYRIGKRAINLPAKGTRVRATLGTTVLYGTAGEQSTSQSHLLFYVVVDGAGYDGFRQLDLWYSSGWTIEILDPEAIDLRESLDRVSAESREAAQAEEARLAARTEDERWQDVLDEVRDVSEAVAREEEEANTEALLARVEADLDQAEELTRA